MRVEGLLAVILIIIEDLLSKALPKAISPVEANEVVNVGIVPIQEPNPLPELPVNTQAPGVDVFEVLADHPTVIPV